MKQHITRKQLNELSDKGKKKLRKWWKPKAGDIIMAYGGWTWESFGGEWVEQTITTSNDGKTHALIPGYMKGDKKKKVSLDPEIIVLYDSPETLQNFYISVEMKLKDSSELGLDGWDWKFLPLLSIGQMIEFLNYNYPMSEPEKLCDTLWEAVKEVLEK